ASALWTDAFHSAAASTVNLSDLEWFLLLYVKHNLWKEAWREASKELRASEAPKLSHFGGAVRPGPGVGHAAEAEKATLETAAAREALFDWARDRLGKERPFLEPLPATQTVLQDSHWNGLRKSMAWRVMLPLLDCLESESDFQGAMEELLVAVDDSPWMLKTLDPQHAQALLTRVARIPPVPAVAGRRAKMASMSFKVPLCSRLIPEEECNLAMVDGELKVDEANLDLSPPAFTGCKHPMLGTEELKPGAAKKVKAWILPMSGPFRVAPVAFGNADPEWRNNRAQAPPELGIVEADPYGTSSSRKCVWAMMLVSILLILHVQRDRYIEALRWHGGIMDHGPPLAWEVQPIVLANDTYEATFLAPSLRRASTFVKLESGAPMAVNGLASTVFSDENFQINTTAWTEKGPRPPHLSSGVGSLVVGSAALRGACQGDLGAPCLVAVQRAIGLAPKEGQGLTACHRFVAGHTVASLAPLTGALCVKSSQIYAAMATATANRSDVVLAWDPRDSRANSRPNSCLALVSFPSMQVMGSLAVDLASAVLHDKVTGSIIMLSFSPSQTIVADQYHAATLKPMLRYSIPISVAWLLHAPKMSDGYLLFLGSEAPFVGSIFAVDLRRQLIYQQDSPQPDLKPSTPS
ncbi:unnamed protein product, partial [Symbiodinium necroappetens]